MSRLNIGNFSRFNSITDFVKFLEKNEPHPKSEKQSLKEPSEKWCMNTDYPTAIDRIKNGFVWEEGLRMMEDAIVESRKLWSPEPVPTIQSAVAGVLPNVAHYLAGLPNAMYSFKPTPIPARPALSIGLDIAAPYMVRAHHKALYAAAIVSHINQLERQGYRCELTLCERLYHGGYEKWSHWYGLDIRVKQLDEHWSASSIIYAAAHPALSRRLVFRHEEIVMPQITQSSYGIPAGSVHAKPVLDMYNESMASDFDVFFPSIAADHNVHSASDAMQLVNKRLNAQLKNLEIDLYA